MADAGYDVSDYRAIDPRFGALAEAETFLREAHQLGLRVVLDIVPNHTSEQHPWFLEAVAEGPGSAARARYLFRPGRGTGELPPNDWTSEFGGPAWTRAADDGEWYLHLFAPEQPDLDWTNPAVRADFEKTLRFWFDRGVDGFRVDVAHSLVKQEGLPDVGGPGEAIAAHPHWDRDEVHDVYREWRAVADSYPDPRIFVAEAWVDRPERLARYVRSDELHTAFNFDFLCAPWLASALREVITTTVAEHAPSVLRPPGCCPTTTWLATSRATRGRRPTGSCDTSTTSWANRQTWRWGCGGPGRPPCSCSRSPEAPTSTRARSWSCPR